MAEPGRSTDRSINLYGEMLEVRVGKEEEKSYVHKSIICASSAFFQTATKKEWDHCRPADSKSIDLTDVDRDTFYIYLDWLYSKKLPLNLEDVSGATLGEYCALAKAYVLGEQIMDTNFKNDVIDGIIALCSDRKNEKGESYYPTGEVAKIIYDGTPESSPGRRLMVDIWARLAHDGWNSLVTNDLPKEFLLDTLKSMQTLRRALYRDEDKLWKVAPESYHESKKGPGEK